MQNPIKNGVHRPLYLLLVLMLLGPLVVGAGHAKGAQALPLLGFLHAIMFSFVSFVWYCRDSDAHGYRRSLMRNIGFNSFGIVFIPYYLVRSRAAGQKWRALFRLAGFGMLMLFATAIGLMLLAFIGA